MKSDLDTLMKAKDMDAILITGPAQHNPFMYYMTGGGHITAGELIKKRGEEPVLFFNPMERDEAVKTGLQTKNLTDYNFKELLERAEGDYCQAIAFRYHQMLEELGITSGRMGVYGKVNIGSIYSVFKALQELLPDLDIVGETGRSVLMDAMATKDDAEIDRIRGMGVITTSVVGKTADMLTSHRVKDGVLIKKDGEPLSIGDVKRKINLWLAELGAENPEGTIFAIGRDAGVPHSAGNPKDYLRIGETIIFDIFPCEAGGGYHYDFTRTWCLGYAPDDVQDLYEDVRSVYHQIMTEVKPNSKCKPYQERTCELFEARGHPTIKDAPQIQAGYVHGLGHGLGLHVHEHPFLGQTATEKDVFAPGVVVTIEPGLYYPDRGMGCRLEDTVWVRPDGKFEILAEYPLDLVLPIKDQG